MKDFFGGLSKYNVRWEIGHYLFFKHFVVVSVDIFRKQPVFDEDFANYVFTISGGRDKRGGPVLTFPSHPDVSDYPHDDLVSCVSYCAGIPW